MRQKKDFSYYEERTYVPEEENLVDFPREEVEFTGKRSKFGISFDELTDKIESGEYGEITEYPTREEALESQAQLFFVEGMEEKVGTIGYHSPPSVWSKPYSNYILVDSEISDEEKKQILAHEVGHDEYASHFYPEIRESGLISFRHDNVEEFVAILRARQRTDTWHRPALTAFFHMLKNTYEPNRLNEVREAIDLTDFKGKVPWLWKEDPIWVDADILMDDEKYVSWRRGRKK